MHFFLQLDLCFETYTKNKLGFGPFSLAINILENEFDWQANLLNLFYLLKTLENDTIPVKMMNCHQGEMDENKDCFRSCATGFFQDWIFFPGFFNYQEILLIPHYISLLAFSVRSVKKIIGIRNDFW